jgi:hypothetical protein
MKKTLLIIAGLLALALLSCSHSGNSSGTSLVTIKLGSDKTASISVEKATLLAKLKNFLADHLQVRSAEALVPSNIMSINVSVKANDMPTISSTLNVAGLTTVEIIVEVPNGLNRQFVITGYDIIPNIAFWGRMFVNLNGEAVTLPISMINLGSVTDILFVSTSGSDSTGDGTEQNPYRTISNALTVTNGSEAIFVDAGTYDDATGGEIFPLQLKAGTALVGLGQNQTTVLNGSSGINGAPGAYIDSLRLFVCDSTGIDDLGSITHINNVILDSSLSCGGGAGDGIVLAADSTVSNTIIRDPFTSGINVTSGNPIIKNNTLTQTQFWSAYGIVVTSGNPIITNSTINGFFADGVGWGVQISAGNAIVSQCKMSGNGGGVGISGGSPTISGNTINNSSSNGGIQVSGGNPTISGNKISNGTYGIYLSGFSSAPSATISGNTLDHNSYGIYAPSVGTSSIHNNSIYCNSYTDFDLADLNASGFDITNNAWDHDATTLPITGPTTTSYPSFCPGGADICYNVASPPNFSPPSPAVPGGCSNSN